MDSPRARGTKRLTASTHIGNRPPQLRTQDRTAPPANPPRSPGNGEREHVAAPRKRQVAVYTYRDSDGNELYQNVRFEPKDFRQRHRTANGKYVWKLPDGIRVPYGLDKLKASEDRMVFVCEGEKDTEALWQLGLLAICGHTGSNGWRPEFGEYLRDRHVAIFPDNDEPGRKYAKAVKTSVQGKSLSVVIVSLPGLNDGEDVSDFIAKGGTRDGLLRAVDEAEKAAMASKDSDADEEDSQPAINGNGHTNGTPHRWEIVSERFSDIKSEPVEWLWEPIWQANALNLLTGQPGVGKTFVACHLAAAVSKGLPWPDGPGKAPVGDVVLMSAEDDYSSVLRPRAEAAGGDVHRIHRWKKKAVLGADGDVDVEDITLEDIDLMERQAVKMPELKLLIFDPCTSFVGKADANDNAEVREILCRLKHLAEDRRVTILLITHDKKMVAEAVNSAIGSLAWTAFPRVVRGLFRDPKDKKGPQRLLLPIKNNHGDDRLGKRIELIGEPGRPATTRLLWHEEPVEMSADEAKVLLSKEAMFAGRDHTEEDTAKRHQAKVLNVIDSMAGENDGWVTQTVIRNGSRLNGQNLESALFQLGHEEILEKQPADKTMPGGGVQKNATFVFRRKRHVIPAAKPPQGDERQVNMP